MASAIRSPYLLSDHFLCIQTDRPVFLIHRNMPVFLFLYKKVYSAINIIVCFEFPQNVYAFIYQALDSLYFIRPQKTLTVKMN